MIMETTKQNPIQIDTMPKWLLKDILVNRRLDIGHFVEIHGNIYEIVGCIECGEKYVEENEYILENVKTKETELICLYKEFIK